MHEKREYFDVMQADELVPRLDYHFGELARVQREVNDLAVQAEKCGFKLKPTDTFKPSGNAIRDALQQRFVALANEYADIVDEIHGLGVIVEDPELGTVNFFSWVDGEEIILSWQYGESAVRHWFKVNEDFMARRPLSVVSEYRASRIEIH